MDPLSLYVYAALALVAFVAGTVDTLAGGGGLITVPAILMTGMNPIAALGTNKLQSAIGELSATLHFMKKKQVDYRLLTIGLVYTVTGSSLGTGLLQITPPERLKKAIPFLLLGVLVYYVVNQRRKRDRGGETLAPDHGKFMALGASIGFYNGFFGPGTGAIWVVALMQAFKLNIQKATMYTNPLNLAGNLTALSLFLAGGKVNLVAAALMGIGSFAGGRFGASLVIYKDARWLKAVFLALMIASTGATFLEYYGLRGPL